MNLFLTQYHLFHRIYFAYLCCQVDESQEERTLGEIERYDALAAAMQQIGLIGIWDCKPLLNGGEIKAVLPKIPKGPAFRDVMEEQERWMVAHPGAPSECLAQHMAVKFPEYV